VADRESSGWVRRKTRSTHKLQRRSAGLIISGNLICSEHEGSWPHALWWSDAQWRFGSHRHVGQASGRHLSDLNARSGRGQAPPAPLITTLDLPELVVDRGGHRRRRKLGAMSGDIALCHRQGPKREVRYRMREAGETAQGNGRRLRSQGGATPVKAARSSMTEEVAGRLRNAILDGSLGPGKPIRQDHFAREYRTSRVPVREALQMLQAEGLVVLHQHSGARVARMDREELLEVYEIRECLEPMAMTVSVPRLQASDIQELETLVDAVEAAAAENDLGRWVMLDRTFHLTAMSRAPIRLLRIVESLWNGTQHYRRQYLVIPGRLARAHAEHRFLLDAIESGSGDDASAICLIHIRRTRRFLAEHPELFLPTPDSQRRVPADIGQTEPAGGRKSTG